MKDLQDAAEKICELKGEIEAMKAAFISIARLMNPAQQRLISDAFEVEAEIVRSVLIGSVISESALVGFDAAQTSLLGVLSTLGQSNKDSS